MVIPNSADVILRQQNCYPSCIAKTQDKEVSMMRDSDRKFGGRCKIATAVTVLVIICAVIGIIVWLTTKSNANDDVNISTAASSSVEVSFNIQHYAVGNVEITADNMTFKLFHERQKTLSGRLGVGASRRTLNDCGQGKNNLCLDWVNNRRLEIDYSRDGDVSCYEIVWKAKKCSNQILKDCFDMGDSHWYGGFEDFHQYWPLERSTRETSAFLAVNTFENKLGDVQERYFISSEGVGLFIDKDVPLFISINETRDNQICITAKYNGYYPYLNPKGALPVLKYHMCQAQNVRKVHDYMSNRFWKKPSDIPDVKLFKFPIWSTWAQYQTKINQTTLLQFAHDIAQHNLPHSQIELDDNWNPKYGDMTFDTVKFPNASQLMKELRDEGFRVTIWVHPFFNIDSDSFRVGVSRGYFLKQIGSDLPALVSWWQGELAAVLDVTNTDAVNWYLESLYELRRNFGISSFKFDAGGVDFIPKVFSFNQTNSNPNTYAERWARLAFKADTAIRHQEVRVGVNTQDLPIFVRILDLTSSWDRNNGLEKLIAVTLTFGLLGYPFVLPDMIGGNGYIGLPDRELFIRWLQVNTFLPAMQFSIGPWLFDEDVINITRTFIQLHANYSDVFVDLAREATNTSAPIIRPLWWVAPDDPHAQTIDSEFLLGNDILVAPILKQGARKRDIYLVEGQWQDMLRGKIRSPGWLMNYRADLHELPYFIRTNSSLLQRNFS